MHYVRLTQTSPLNGMNVQVPRWLKDNADSKHAAVYAVVGKDETVNFVGVSRNVAVAVAAHVASEGEDKVHSLKVRYSGQFRRQGYMTVILFILYFCRSYPDLLLANGHGSIYIDKSVWICR